MRRHDLVYRHFTDEEVAKANSVSLLDLALRYGFETESGGKKAIHLKNSGGLYIFPETNRFYHWTSENKGGAVNFVMDQENISFPEAVAKLIDEEYITHIREVIPYEKKPKEPLVLPDKAQNFKRAYWYLVSVRGIDPEIVSHFMNAKMIYQEAQYGNCVFVGYDTDGSPKYCAMRSSSPKSSFKMDAENSDKSYPFYHEGKSNLVIVNESPIDLMSHATLGKIYFKIDWRQDHRVSLGCLWDGALDRYLKNHSEINRIIFGVDNDYLSRDKDMKLTNWGQRTADKWCEKYTGKGYKCAIHQPHLKDFNKDLTEMRKGRTPDDLDKQRMSELQADFEKDAVEDPPEEHQSDKSDDELSL
jgi:hypothetical protein